MEQEKVKSKKWLIILFSVIVVVSLAVILLLTTGVISFKSSNTNNIENNNKNEGIIEGNNSNITKNNNENLEYDIKTYQVGSLYFEDFNDYYINYEKMKSVKYNDAKDIDGEITIEDNNIFLKYEKDNIMQNKKINIGGENPNYVMIISANVVRYVYILTEDGNVYLNTNNSDDINAFLNFSKVNNLTNVSGMFTNYQKPYFIINDQIYNVYGEIAHHELIIKSDDVDMQTSTGNNYYMQVGNDGLLYKNIIKKSYIIGSPEDANSILSHQKQGIDAYKSDNGENIYVSILFGINKDTFLIDKNGNYYKIETNDNNEIKLNSVNSKKVISVNKYSKSSVVKKIEINYSDDTKDAYSLDNSESIW